MSRENRASGAKLDTKAMIAECERRGWPDDLPSSTYELIRQAAERQPDDVALSFIATAATHHDPFVWTFEEYRRSVTQTANMLHRLGVSADDVVAIVLPNLPETYFSLWGAEACAAAHPINPMLEPAGIAGQLQASGASTVITLDQPSGPDLYRRVNDAVASSPKVQRIITVSTAAYARRNTLPEQDGPPPPAPAERAPAGVLQVNFDEASAAASNDVLESLRVIRPRDTASLFSTGGSTGAPKLARRTHGNEVANAFMGTASWGDALHGGVVFAGLPLFHVNGAMVTGLVPLIAGASVLLATPDGFRDGGVIERFWEIVSHHQVRTFSGVPTLLSILLQQSPIGHDLKALEFVICGAAPLSSNLTDQFERATGVRILEGYGLTEATCTVSVNPIVGETKAGSVGLPLPFQQVRIAVLDMEGRWIADAPVEQTGTVVLSGPNIIPGYLSGDQESDLWLTAPDGSRWLNTGDLGTLDADGYLWLRGRSKDVIIRGGHNIDPAVIEDACYLHPVIALAAAVGRPDAHAGEVPVVYIQLKPGAEATEAELLELISSGISERAARPKAVYILDALPLTPVGKVFKPALRALAAA